MKKSILISLLLAFFLQANLFAGAMPPPTPPSKNPNPPKTVKDKARVDFAIKAAQYFLGEQHGAKLPLQGGDYGKFTNKDSRCIKSPACWKKNISFNRELKVLHSGGAIKTTRHAHVIPWSMKKYQSYLKPNSSQESKRTPELTKQSSVTRKPAAIMGPNLKQDEYMIHIYVQYGRSNRWHHLDVILSEDKKGNLQLRHFYSIPIPYREVDLPPGVVC